MGTFEEFTQQYVESAAYHEATHEVICVVLKIPIREQGLHIDTRACGLALTFRRSAGDLKNDPIDIHEREQSIILLNAGYIGQVRVFPDVPIEDSQDDRSLADALLSEMYEPNSAAYQAAKYSLRDKAEQLVTQYWPVIEALAKELLAKPWTDRVMLPPASMGWSNDVTEKSMDAQEVQEILTQFGLTAIIRQDDAGSYAHPIKENKNDAT